MYVSCSEKEAKRHKLLQEKALYTAGLWNTNTVMMGGLGHDPPKDIAGEAIVVLCKIKAIAILLQMLLHVVVVIVMEETVTTALLKYPCTSTDVPDIGVSLMVWYVGGLCFASPFIVHRTTDIVCYCGRDLNNSICLKKA